MIIPALDVLDSQIVRLYQGKYDTAQFYPFDLQTRLHEYQDSGAIKLHLVDLEGARDPSKKQWQQIQNATNKLDTPYQVGGGIRSYEDIKQWLKAGAGQVVIGSLAVDQKEQLAQWIEEFGAERFVIALDVNKSANGWSVATHGWLSDSTVSLFELIDFYLNIGVYDFLCTDISKDGTMTGPSFELYEQIVQHNPAAKVQASGGVSSLDDIKRLVKIGVSGIILGKSLLDNAFTVEEAIACYRSE
ncbi:1-(5-phosphoribosyl)-5-[(5-phosphoribosylamino)methylideneamino] imidazole-4-carboxamide isomerase [Pseudoalteromonas luteoviolacea CPMOR-2]|uniref:1-(5-phosphoribosyl)-5-[(5-phosphoribosylamino)methylideneamino] imidazole-4-carboxamide isomerase n=1 Tax=Pseudoalteromonas luteoviolacea DSM 6061 TaxID=1365250 RepID=A0A161ZYQ5_9GAMM|nr:1-(5-phosphoribosyl)-5-[(5-phosphoribosylamino)methylideneamino]imidazole-4-carboxamide isomerase [Pseudoalteromonas luteoviolacea]KZN39165.1 1-(5-phosphoribosyl)-5-[(5-phosphoribosylamino)methylideneamino] imidazole-4-carboxamide isomerase [Pseudoalteromonas luteoviolacea DSM 6061]KZN57027.1 1-(5-phosphoribosyl)-5-[(5-phosphoribosylamino)methylideneamino] imidazole-4-carboxamide isomerase [Pseudoalteromonas luteoviolacea CPMOR-2]MBE0390060.1 phosphoribosylformimino-5-aminoimidazole carboxami